MKHFTVFDNPELQDRYTVVIGQDVYGMSDYPDSPHGLCMYIGTKSNFEIKYLGQKIDRVDIPSEVLKAIKRRGGE